MTEKEVQEGFTYTSVIKLRSIFGFIETWRENTSTSTCSESQNIFRPNLER